MERSYWEPLELNKIIARLAEFCSNDATKAMAMQLEPQTDIRTVSKELAKTDDAFQMSVALGTPSFYNFKNVTGAIKRAQSGAKLSLRELLDVGLVLRQIRTLFDWHKQWERLDSPLNDYFCSLTPNRYLEDKLDNAIVSEDEISDSASSELASIRRKINQASSRIRETLDKMVRSSTVQKNLQENLVTLRNGRYVLPVKAEAKGNVPGFVHDTSASGATYFIEPMAVVEANNDIRVLKGRELDEIDRIIKELSGDCADSGERILADFETAAYLNLYFAKANFGAKLNGIVPQITEDGNVYLKNARHPLIGKETVVPITVELGEKYQALIITGPNTGGKTVALKTVGLLTAMTMCGMMIPASDGSRVSVFKKILVDIGDQQSIEQSLSTFSSHMNRVVEILGWADKESLILLDELGSGTDPVEGAALAVSVLEALKNCGSRLMVTTHYQELKMYAIEHEGVENASCEFDVATLQPTYRLIVGSPGKSNAFAISSRLGLPERVIQHARSLVSTENQRLENVITQLDKTRLELENQKNELYNIKITHKKELETLQEEKQAFDKQKEVELEKARQQAMAIVSRVRGQSDLLLEELAAIRKQKDADLSLEARARIRSAVDGMYKEANPVVSRSNEGYVLPRPLEKGDSVYLIDFDRKGMVLSLPDSSGNMLVQSGSMKTKIKVDRVRLVEKTAHTGKRTVKSSPKKTIGLESKVTRGVSQELDIRGCMTDEGVHELAMFLNNAVMSGIGLVTVIHGKGTGALRQAVQRELKAHPSVKGFRLGTYGEGEDGVTIVELK